MAWSPSVGAEPLGTFTALPVNTPRFGGSRFATAVIVRDGSPDDATVAVYVPSADPSVQVVRTSPLASVVPLAGANDWLAPDAGVNVTVAFGTAVPIVVTTLATTCFASGDAARPV